jgi:hypothetical protein
VSKKETLSSRLSIQSHQRSRGSSGWARALSEMNIWAMYQATLYFMQRKSSPDQRSETLSSTLNLGWKEWDGILEPL